MYKCGSRFFGGLPKTITFAYQERSSRNLKLPCVMGLDNFNMTYGRNEFSPRIVSMLLVALCWMYSDFALWTNRPSRPGRTGLAEHKKETVPLKRMSGDNLTPRSPGNYAVQTWLYFSARFCSRSSWSTNVVTIKGQNNNFIFAISRARLRESK